MILEGTETTIYLPHIVWSASSPIDGTMIKGKTSPTIEQRHYENFIQHVVDLKMPFSYHTSVTYITKNPAKDKEEFGLIWNNGDDWYECFLFDSLEEAKEFQLFLNSCECYWDLTDILEEAKDCFRWTYY